MQKVLFHFSKKCLVLEWVYIKIRQNGKYKKTITKFKTRKDALSTEDIIKILTAMIAISGG